MGTSFGVVLNPVDEGVIRFTNRTKFRNRQILEIAPFSRHESVSYLAAKLPRQNDGADTLAETLGDLPLALAQAAAYIADNQFLTCAAYQQRLSDSRSRLTDMLPEFLPDDYPVTVAATLAMSIPHANERAPVGLAGPLLRFASVLLCDHGAPLSLFTAPATVSYLEGFSDDSVDTDVVMDALACLHRLNLITLNLQCPHRGVRMHAVLRLVARDVFTRDEIADVIYVAAVALVESLTTHRWYAEDSVELGWALDDCDRMLHRLSSLPSLVGRGAPLALLTRHNLVHQHTPGSSVHESGLLRWYLEGRTDRTEPLQQIEEAVHARSGALGPEHLHTPTARHNLTRALGGLGRYTEAITELRHLADDYSRILGPDHPHALTARHNLAYWRGEEGDVVGAARALESLLADPRSRRRPPAHDRHAAQPRLPPRTHMNTHFVIENSCQRQPGIRATDELSQRIRLAHHSQPDGEPVRRQRGGEHVSRVLGTQNGNDRPLQLSSAYAPADRRPKRRRSTVTVCRAGAETSSPAA